MEIFKTIQGHEDFEVSNLGRVRRAGTEEYLKQFKVNERNRVNLDGKRPYVGRLVAMEFVLNPKNKPFVTHKDGNKANDVSTNLVWVTNKEAQVIAVIRKRLNKQRKNM